MAMKRGQMKMFKRVSAAEEATAGLTETITIKRPTVRSCTLSSRKEKKTDTN